MKRVSASYIVREVRSVRERERERERERDTETDGSDVTIVALKLAMSLHFPCQKIRTFRFSLANFRLSLFHMVTIVALKFAVSSHFPLPKKFALSGPTFLNVCAVVITLETQKMWKKGTSLRRIELFN